VTRSSSATNGSARKTSSRPSAARTAGRVLQHGDGVLSQHVRSLGDLEDPHLARHGRRDVGAVHEAGVGLAELHLAHHRLHVLFLGDDIVAHAEREVGRESARPRQLDQHRAGVPAHGHGLRRDDDLHAAPRQVAQVLDARQVLLRHDDHELVAGEEPRLAGDPVEAAHVVQPPPVGRSEDVGHGALLDLRGELLGSGEVEAHRHAGVNLLEGPADLGEALGERGGGEDGEGLGGAHRHGGGEEAQGGEEPESDAARGTHYRHCHLPFHV
jgi:hypothetical protein